MFESIYEKSILFKKKVIVTHPPFFKFKSSPIKNFKQNI